MKFAVVQVGWLGSCVGGAPLQTVCADVCSTVLQVYCVLHCAML
jgi:hypothetical protein